MKTPAEKLGVNSDVMHASRFLLLIKSGVLVGFVGLLLHLSCGLAHSQAQWKPYTSPDKTFLVEAPAPFAKSGFI